VTKHCAGQCGRSDFRGDTHSVLQSYTHTFSFTKACPLGVSERLTTIRGEWEKRGCISASLAQCSHRLIKILSKHTLDCIVKVEPMLLMCPRQPVPAAFFAGTPSLSSPLPGPRSLRTGIHWAFSLSKRRSLLFSHYVALELLERRWRKLWNKKLGLKSLWNLLQIFLLSSFRLRREDLNLTFFSSREDNTQIELQILWKRSRSSESLVSAVRQTVWRYIQTNLKPKSCLIIIRLTKKEKKLTQTLKWFCQSWSLHATVILIIGADDHWAVRPRNAVS